MRKQNTWWTWDSTDLNIRTYDMSINTFDLPATGRGGNMSRKEMKVSCGLVINRPLPGSTQSLCENIPEQRTSWRPRSDQKKKTFTWKPKAPVHLTVKHGGGSVMVTLHLSISGTSRTNPLFTWSLNSIGGRHRAAFFPHLWKVLSMSLALYR